MHLRALRSQVPHPCSKPWDYGFPLIGDFFHSSTLPFSLQLKLSSLHFAALTLDSKSMNLGTIKVLLYVRNGVRSEDSSIKN